MPHGGPVLQYVRVPKLLAPREAHEQAIGKPRRSERRARDKLPREGWKTRDPPGQGSINGQRANQGTRFAPSSRRLSRALEGLSPRHSVIGREELAERLLRRKHSSSLCLSASSSFECCRRLQLLHGNRGSLPLLKVVLFFAHAGGPGSRLLTFAVLLPIPGPWPPIADAGSSPLTGLPNPTTSPPLAMFP